MPMAFCRRAPIHHSQGVYDAKALTTTAMALMLGCGRRARGRHQDPQAQSTPSRPPSRNSSSARVSRCRRGPDRYQQRRRDQRRRGTAQSKRIFSALDANGDSKLSPQESAGLTAIEPGYVVVTRMIPVVVTADVGGQCGRGWIRTGPADQPPGVLRSTASGSSRRRRRWPRQADHRRGATGCARRGQSRGAEEDVARWREAGVDRHGDNIIAPTNPPGLGRYLPPARPHGDERLSQDELKRVQPQKAMIDRRFARLDSNGDGRSLWTSTQRRPDRWTARTSTVDGDVTEAGIVPNGFVRPVANQACAEFDQTHLGQR